MNGTRLLLVNPWASGVNERRVAAVRAALPSGTHVHLTTKQGDAAAFARDLDGHIEALYVFGGDGTYNEVLNGLAARTARMTPLGFIPGGGASVLPRALGLPRGAVAAARRLAVGTHRRIGVGRANGHRFGFACGIGLDAELVRSVDELGRRKDGRRPGDLAFAWSGLRVLSRHGFALAAALEIEGHGRAAFALVSNGPTYSYAGPVALRPAGRATFEGGLDLVAPRQLNARELPRIARYAFAGAEKARDDDVIYIHDADRIEISCERPLPLQVDGEDLGDVERVVIEAERDAITVLV